MSEGDALRDENEQLRRELADARKALSTLASGGRENTDDGGSTRSLLFAAQEQLRDHQRLAAAVFDGSLDALVLADDDGNYVEANPAACELFGLPRQWLIGRNVAEFSAPRAETGHAWSAFVREGTSRGQFLLTRPDGSRRYLDYVATGNVLPGLHLSVLRDITGSAQNDARFQALVEKSDNAISLTAEDGTTLYMSPAMERIFGLEPGDSRGRSIFEFLHPEDREVLRAGRAAILHDPSTVATVEYRIVRPDGSLRWVEGTGRNLIHDPSVGAIVGNLRDISDRKRAAEVRGTGDANGV